MSESVQGWKQDWLEAERDLDFLAVLRVLLKYRYLILGITLCAGIISYGVLLTSPDVYKAEALLAPTERAGEGGGASMLSQFGGLASLAGVSLGKTSSIDESLAVLNSRAFLWLFIQENNLMPLLFSTEWDASRKQWRSPDSKKQPNMWDAYRLLTETGVLHVGREGKADLVTISVEWRDPVLAAKWANDLVLRLNEYLRQQAIVHSQSNLQYLTEALERTQSQEVRQSLFSLISQEQKVSMLATTQKEFAFRIIDSAETPDKKVKPKRLLISLASMIVVFILSIIGALVWNGIRFGKDSLVSRG